MNSLYNPPTIDEYLKKAPHPMRKKGGGRSSDALDRYPGFPLVTVCTIVRNGENTLAQTIATVVNQSYPNIESIIVDGASTDGTLNLINLFNDKIDLWISEPDFGTCDAINKAISHAKGDYIFLIHSDDWAEPDHVKYAIETLGSSGADFVFGNTKYYDGNTRDFTQLGDPDYASSITYKMPRLNTPSMVLKKACFERIGLYDLRYKVAPDYEWLLRLHVRGGKGVYDGRLNICHRLGGISSKQFVLANSEARLASIQHGFSPARATRAFLSQCVRRKLRQLAQMILPKVAYRSILRWIRAGYSSS